MSAPSGNDAALVLRSCRFTRAVVPTVVLFGVAEAPMGTNGRAFAGFLPKPSTAERLSDTVRRAMATPEPDRA